MGAIMLSGLLFLLNVLSANTNTQSITLKLWPEGIPISINCSGYIENIDKQNRFIEKIVNPQLIVYLSPKEKANGTAVLICPDGGYCIIAINHEGYDIAKWLNDHGIAGIILKYRLPSDKIMKNKSVGFLRDAQEAMQKIRSNAAQWNIGQRKMVIMGFSAGVHLAPTLSTHYNDKVYDLKGQTSARPALSILVYPVIRLPPIPHPPFLYFPQMIEMYR